MIVNAPMTHPDMIPVIETMPRGMVGMSAEITGMMTRRMILALASGTVGAAAASGWARHSFSRAMESARARIASYRPNAIVTRFGRLEYAEAGHGAPVLMIHGSGGGFDQGMLFAEPLIERGMRVIAPSRFGYLGTDFPEVPSSENQADALVELLDQLAIDKIAVVGGSAGALSAQAFAIRHPDRCAALVALVPATYAPNRPAARPWSPPMQRIVKSALESDFLYWTLTGTASDMLIGSVLATDPALLDAAGLDERLRVQSILQAILPVSARARGLINDMRLAGNPDEMAIASITAPTLAISCEDDRYLTADAARHIAATVPGARSIIYPSGGHLWVGHNSDAFSAIHDFIKETIS